MDSKFTDNANLLELIRNVLDGKEDRCCQDKKLG